MANRTGFLITFTLLCIAAAIFVPAVPQPIEYHDFADQRSLFGIPNFFDVTSNIGFLLVGIAGLVVVINPRTPFVYGRERWPYAIFFVGMVLTGLGSGYYHLLPNNERLFWDRLPMTISFMSLIAAQIADRISVKAGLLMLPPMLLIGAASVLYWIATERAGAGNVVPYGILQVYSVVTLLAIALLYPSRYTRGNDIYGVFLAYVLAKILEALDSQVFDITHLVSGHTLKHFAAAIAGLVVVRMLVLRRPDEHSRSTT